MKAMSSSTALFCRSLLVIFALRMEPSLGFVSTTTFVSGPDWQHHLTTIQEPLQRDCRAVPTLVFHSPSRSRKYDYSRLFLNRFLFDPNEVDFLLESDADADAHSEATVSSATSISTTTTAKIVPPTVTLPADDYRTLHAAKILGLHNNDTIRAGIVSSSAEDQDDNDADSNANPKRGGLLTDTATIEWIPQGKVKKAEPLAKSGKPPGLLRIHLHNLVAASDSELSANHVSLILALPRPLQLGRLLPMISQMGVRHLILTGAGKVPKDYFGSHLFRKPQQLRDGLVEGLCQAGDVLLPDVRVMKQLRHLEQPPANGKDDGQQTTTLSLLDELFPLDEYARVVAHPLRTAAPSQDDNDATTTTTIVSPIRMDQVHFPSSSTKKMVLAVGPEGGWVEPNELDWFLERGFQHVTLGPRVLRSDCAVVSLLALAHFVCSGSE